MELDAKGDVSDIFILTNHTEVDLSHTILEIRVVEVSTSLNLYRNSELQLFKK